VTGRLMNGAPVQHRSRPARLRRWRSRVDRTLGHQHLRDMAGQLRDVLVISPHLDDAALSLGMTISMLVRQGASVTVATVFANDVEGIGPSSPWDHSAGFSTARAAAQGRRYEDRKAMSILGAEAFWLSLPDVAHRANDPNWSNLDPLGPLLASADLVLLPGFPLTNPDHRLLTEYISRAPRERCAYYVEQPYAANLWLKGRSGLLPSPATLPDLPSTVRWVRVLSSAADVRAKHAAIAAYGSQLRPLGPGVRTRIALFDACARGELIGLPITNATKTGYD
jgi:LmbE family N-acetylglucosaminyl deacetylase